MTLKDIAHQRLHLQQISQPSFENPADVVKRLGVVQAQDYLGALWAVGLRTQKAREVDIEKILTDKSIIRTWPLRGTLHFVAAADARWMLALSKPRLVAKHTKRLKKEFDLDDKIFTRCEKILIRALEGGKQLSRDAVYKTLESSKISTTGSRGLHILWRLAQEGLICFGARDGKQHTFTLLEEWIPSAKPLSHDEALAELTARYFTGHGPATLQDFTWWSGLSPADTKAGLALVKSKLMQEKVADHIFWMGDSVATKPLPVSAAYLLPSYDEFMVAYADRSAALDPAYFGKMVSHGNGIFNPIIVINGKVVGTWKRTIDKKNVAIDLSPFKSLSTAQFAAVKKVAKKYGVFIDKEIIYQT